MSKAPRIAIAAGGSGGHLYPALSVARALREAAGAEVLFVTGRKKIEEDILKAESPSTVLRLRAAAYRGWKSLLSPSFVASIFADFVDTFGFLKRSHPDFAIGFGGYHSIPLIAAARLLGIPTLIQEQNAELGLANRLLMRMAASAACAFRAAAERAGVRKAWASGMPMRGDLRGAARGEALAALGLDPARKTLAVMGGSQGARAVNDAVREWAGARGGRGGAWQIVHLAGEADAAGLQAYYDEQKIPSRVFSFYADMSIIYAGADLIVSRAGAVTLHEIAYFSKPAVLIPYPLARGHQIQNARALADAGGAVLILQEELASGRLRTELDKLLADSARLEEMGAAASRALDTRGAQAITTYVLSRLDAKKEALVSH